MLSTDLEKEAMTKRIGRAVSTLMEERPLFKEDFDDSDMVEHLVKAFDKYLSYEEFQTISDESLKERCSKIMAFHLLGKIGEAFTPEQMIIFEEAIKRK